MTGVNAMTVGKTLFRDAEKDNAFDTEQQVADRTGNDLLTTYVFDRYGQTVCAYSTNSDSSETYGATGTVYHFYAADYSVLRRFQRYLLSERLGLCGFGGIGW